MKLLLLISLLSLNAFSEEYPPMKEEYKNIEDMITKLERDVEEQQAQQPQQPVKAAKAAPARTAVPVQAPAPVAAESVEPQVVEAKPAPAPAPVAAPAKEAKPVVAANHEEIKSYVDEKQGKKYHKQLKVVEGLSGPSEYSSSRDSQDIEGVYHYSYMPPASDEGFDERGLYGGMYGQLVLNMFGEYVLFYKGTTNRNTWGADIQVGWQIPLDPFAIALLVSGGARGSNTPGVKLYEVGPRLRASVRISPWVFPFLEGGIEFAKLESMTRWVYPYTVVSGGFMFRLGKADRKSEYNLHKDYNVSQVMLIVAGDIITSPELNVVTPDCGVIKFGISFEFF